MSPDEPDWHNTRHTYHQDNNMLYRLTLLVPIIPASWHPYLWKISSTQMQTRPMTCSWARESLGWEPVVHACNLSYAGGRDQEDHSSKPAWANSSGRLYLKKPFSEIGLVEWLKVKALSSSPSTSKKKRIIRMHERWRTSFPTLCYTINTQRSGQAWPTH
jgi:hypothetical protein